MYTEPCESDEKCRQLTGVENLCFDTNGVRSKQIPVLSMDRSPSLRHFLVVGTHVFKGTVSTIYGVLAGILIDGTTFKFSEHQN